MQTAIQVGQVRPSVLSRLERTVKNLKARFDRAVCDSEFCRVLGITPWHFSLQGLAVTVAVFLILAVVCGVAEWLEGGAL